MINPAPYENIVFLITMEKLIVLLSLITLLVSCKQNNPKVIIETNLGEITLELYEKEAPLTSKNFIRYIDEKRYEGATFYRVVTPNNQPDSKIRIEVVQGGLYEDDHPQALPPIAHENTKQTGIKHLDGVISMARYGPGTATFEFFICVGDQPSLDCGGNRNPDNYGFAAFGKVIDGMDVIRQIHQQPEKDQYLEPRIPINNMRIVY
ncbi:MAG: peptidylprolyl isomerase [Bacteroidetes bacterium]|nr:peptidylprolyl isomerase [Bacteroidota bacterium]